MGTIKTDIITGLADPNKITLPSGDVTNTTFAMGATLSVGSTTATLNFGNTVLANTSAGSSTITGEGGSNTTNIQQGLAKAFITFDESAEQIFSSQDSFNIASTNDAGTGNYAVTFTSNMATVRYQAPGGCYTTLGTTLGTAAEATTGTSMRLAANDGTAINNDCYMVITGTMA